MAQCAIYQGLAILSAFFLIQLRIKKVAGKRTTAKKILTKYLVNKKTCLF